MEDSLLIAGLVTFALFYVLTFYLTYTHQSQACITIRSTFFIYLTTTACFLLSLVYCSYLFIPEDENCVAVQVTCWLFPKNYLFFHLFLFLSICLKFVRLYFCSAISTVNETEYVRKRHFFRENFYVKLMVYSSLCILIGTLAVNFISASLPLQPFFFNVCGEKTQTNSLQWVILNGVENYLLAYLTYKCFTTKMKSSLKLEILANCFVWVLYPNTLRMLDFRGKNEDTDFNVFTCLGFYSLIAFVNAIYPIIESKLKAEVIRFSFSPRLIGSFFLFLSDEKCVRVFHDYLALPEKKVLSLYLRGMTLRLKGKRRELKKEELDNILSKFGVLEGNSYTDLDMALKHCFSILKQQFKAFRQTEQFNRLINSLEKKEIMKCKLQDVGLINI